jgi:hypothetical protein
MLLALGSPAAAQPALVADPPLCEPEQAPPPVDVTQLDEAALRAMIGDIWIRNGREAAIAELRRRFPSPATRAFADNAEAADAILANEPERALAIATRVRAEHGGSRDPDVELQVARAILLQTDAIETAEAVADRGPFRPLTPADIDLDSRSNLLRRELIDLFGDRPDPAMRALVGWQRYNLLVGETLAAGRHSDEGYGAIVDELRPLIGHPDVGELIARILFDLAFVEADDERQIARYDEIIRLFPNGSGPQLRQVVADSYANKAFALEQLGREAEAARVQEEHLAWLDRVDPGRPEDDCLDIH